MFVLTMICKGRRFLKNKKHIFFLAVFLKLEQSKIYIIKIRVEE